MLLLKELELDSICAHEDTNLQEVVKILEITGRGICLVVNSVDKKLYGTITDGDIRRHILDNGDLQSRAKIVASKDPISAPINFSTEQYRDICKVNRIKQLPLIGSDRQIKGLFLLDSNVEDYKDCRFVIMAGGRGTRLKPYTDNCPKPMLEVGGKPIIERIIAKASYEGFKNISISVNYLKEIIIEYLGNGEKLGVNIEYIHEDKPLGTAGSLSQLKKKEQHLFITNGDVLTDVSYKDICDFHIMNKSQATMAVKSYEWSSPFGVVETDGINIKSIKEKPVYTSYINAGIYCLDAKCLDLLAEEEYCDMPSLFDRVKNKKHKTIVYPMHEPWIDVGRPTELTKARNITN